MKNIKGLLFAAALVVGSGTGFAQAQDDSLPGPSATAAQPGARTIAAPAPMQANTLPQAGVLDENYHLGAGDKMRITVYDEPDLSGEFIVDGSGQVQFPLVGQVNAAGFSVHQFVDQLGAALGAKYLKDPKVSVEIENFRPFYIMGEVTKPGEYPYENGLNILGAVALAGGYTYRANSSDVYIRRQGDTKETHVPASTDTRISPGDVVRIPERMF